MVARDGIEGDVGDALDVGVVLAAALGELHAAEAAVEEWGAELIFEHADAVGCGGDSELLAGQHEALVACGGVEESESGEGWQGPHEWRCRTKRNRALTVTSGCVTNLRCLPPSRP